MRLLDCYIEFRKANGRLFFICQHDYPGRTLQEWTVIGIEPMNVGNFICLENEDSTTMRLPQTVLDSANLGDKFTYSDETGLQPIRRTVLEIEL